MYLSRPNKGVPPSPLPHGELLLQFFFTVCFCYSKWKEMICSLKFTVHACTCTVYISLLFWVKFLLCICILFLSKDGTDIHTLTFKFATCIPLLSVAFLVIIKNTMMEKQVWFMPSSIVLTSDFWNQFPYPLLVGKIGIALNFSLCKLMYVERKPSCWSL